ncbi:MAG TPA: triose-phosphate isomerase [Thermoanaerobaculia bacterium]|jgi:triosephosphate isomerase
MPNRYAIANWKMNLPPEGVEKYLGALADAKGGGAVVVAPPFPFLKDVYMQAPKNVGVAAQNCADRQSGAFTGEVAPSMLRYCGARYVIIGHSERRNLFREDDALIGRKLALAIETGLTPVFCIGEDQSARDRGRQSIVVSDQIKVVEGAVPASAGEVIVAYEPIWAIGTGRNATGAMVAEMVAEIRAALGRFWPPQFAQNAPVLYGGSVTPDNIDDLIRSGNVDGFLVGGASLDSRKFLAIAGVL